jgi:hypothetical protein
MVLHDLGTQIETGWKTAVSTTPMMKKVSTLPAGKYPSLSFQRLLFNVNVLNDENSQKIIIAPKSDLPYWNTEFYIEQDSSKIPAEAIDFDVHVFRHSFTIQRMNSAYNIRLKYDISKKKEIDDSVSFNYDPRTSLGSYTKFTKALNVLFKGEAEYCAEALRLLRVVDPKVNGTGQYLKKMFESKFITERFCKSGRKYLYYILPSFILLEEEDKLNNAQKVVKDCFESKYSIKTPIQPPIIVENVLDPKKTPYDNMEVQKYSIGTIDSGVLPFQCVGSEEGEAYSMGTSEDLERLLEICHGIDLLLSVRGRKMNLGSFHV